MIFPDYFNIAQILRVWILKIRLITSDRLLQNCTNVNKNLQKQNSIEI